LRQRDTLFDHAFNMKRERLEGVLVGLLYGFAQAGTPWQVGEDDAVAVIRTLSIVLNDQRSVKPRIQLLTSATSTHSAARSKQGP
jgi:hypothetical protein